MQMLLTIRRKEKKKKEKKKRYQEEKKKLPTAESFHKLVCYLVWHFYNILV